MSTTTIYRYNGKQGASVVNQATKNLDKALQAARNGSWVTVEKWNEVDMVHTQPMSSKEFLNEYGKDTPHS
jgi:hypothetical protein